MTIATRRSALLALAGAFVVLGAAALGPTTPRGARQPTVLAAARAPLSLGFVANHGLAESGFSHVLMGDSTTVLFSSAGLSLRQVQPPTAAVQPCGATAGANCSAGMFDRPVPPDPLAPMAAGGQAGDATHGTVTALDLVLVGSRPGIVPEAQAATGTTFSRFRGARADWQHALPMYGRLQYREVWPGIDLVWETGPRQLKHQFIVHPGANPSVIRLAWHGARALRTTADGALEVQTEAAPVRDEPPVAWQEQGGQRQPVVAAYRVAATSAGEAPSYSFSLGLYDPTATLIIDPAVFVSASFLGSEGADRGLGVAIGPQGHIFLCGEFGEAAYVARLGTDGMTLDWLALLDGKASDGAFDVAVDSAGAAVVTGATKSGDGSFPVRGGPDLSFNGGVADGFVARVTPDGADLEWSGFFGGAGIDFGEGVVVGTQGQVTLTGIAGSSEATFPVVVGPDLTHNGGFDAWVGRLKPQPTAPDVLDNYLWSGFIGGAGDDVLNRVTGPNVSWSSGHIALGAGGDTFISGQTTSDASSFPDGDGFGSLPGFDHDYGGKTDAWVARIQPDGRGLAWATYLGGDSYDQGKGMAVDARGAAWLTGRTVSDERSFPVAGQLGDLSGTYQGEGDAFLARLSPDGRQLELSGYIGGDDVDGAQAVAMAPDGAIIVTGATESNQDYFPVTGGPDLTFNGPDGLAQELNEADAFVGRLRLGSGRQPRWDFLSFIGGAGHDSAFWAAVAPSGRVVVVGDTDSDERSFPDGRGRGVRPGLPEKYHGAGDAFVAVIDWRPPHPRAIVPWAAQGLDRSAMSVPVPVSPGPGPLPTGTRLPTSTPTPTTPPAVRQPTPVTGPAPCEEFVLTDDFEDAASGWLASADVGVSQGYLDGAYEMAAEPNYRVLASSPLAGGAPDAIIEATILIRSGRQARAGILFGAPTSGIAFTISGEGGYALEQRYGTGWRSLSAASVVELIRPLGQQSRLRVELAGSRVTLLVNGQVVDVVDSAAFAEPGPPGLILRNLSTVRGEARFDDFAVTRPLACRPSPTPPLPTPDVGRLLYRDDFEDPTSDWFLSDDANVRSHYVAGEYEILLRAASKTAYRQAPRLRCTECALEVTVHMPATVPAAAGLTIWEGGAGGRIYCQVDSDGRITIVRQTDAGRETLVAPKAVAVARTGPGVSNRLRVVRRPGHLEFTVNHSAPEAIDIATLSENGGAGVVLSSFAEPGAIGQFDNFEAWSLPSSP